ncbi:MAG: DUF3109 family protein [Flavobacteriaceae bacterium]|nr:DUF3109 family protein [Flavobacteriaceae bacterium]
MIQIGKTIVSEEIIKKEFICNLSRCKGQCCIDGDAGAPLEEKELQIMRDIYPKVKPFMRALGITEVEKKGTYTTNEEGKHETTLINDADCVYVIYDDKTVAFCAIEAAYNQGKITFKKPISCHLYPVRVQDYSEFSAVNYNERSICDDACSLGVELQVPIYKFVRQALVLKFGQNWYQELELAAKNLQ